MNNDTTHAKVCCKCEVMKPLTEYYIQTRRPDGRQDFCKDCKKAYNREHYRKNRERYLETAAARTAHRRHRLTDSEWAALQARSEGVCEICKTRPHEVIDHDHECHKANGCKRCVRGLLCKRCNALLGMAEDNPELLHAAATYLASARPLVAATV